MYILTVPTRFGGQSKAEWSARRVPSGGGSAANPGVAPDGYMIDAGLDALRPFASLSKLGSAFGIKGIAEGPGTPYVAVVVALLLKGKSRAPAHH